MVTSAEDAYWQEGQLTIATGNADITVSEATRYQDWDGFGATFNEKGWQVLQMLDANTRNEAIELLFGEAGARLAYGRIPIGASDYALDRYTLAEEPNDYTMSSFSIERDRENLIPYIQAALAIQPDILFFASPWTPPPWMKDNGAYDRGNMKGDPQTLDAHALYLARFVEEYASEDIPIQMVMPQNEPGYVEDYPSCSWSAAVMADYIANHLGPLFAERLPATQIWLGTMSNPDDRGIVQEVMSNETAREYVSGLALQWNMGAYAPEYVSRYGLPIMQSEHQAGNYPWKLDTYERSAPNDHAYAVESWALIAAWIRSGVNSYVAWNMVLDTEGLSLDTVRPWAQNALLTVDTASRQLITTPAYYVFRHLSQFVDPGAVRIGTSGSFGDALAFENPDGSIVAVLYNGGRSARKTILAAGTTKVQFRVPARGWATVSLERQSG